MELTVAQREHIDTIISWCSSATSSCQLGKHICDLLRFAHHAGVSAEQAQVYVDACLDASPRCILGDRREVFVEGVPFAVSVPVELLVRVEDNGVYLLRHAAANSPDSVVCYRDKWYIRDGDAHKAAMKQQAWEHIHRTTDLYRQCIAEKENGDDESLARCMFLLQEHVSQHRLDWSLPSARGSAFLRRLLSRLGYPFSSALYVQGYWFPSELVIVTYNGERFPLHQQDGLYCGDDGEYYESASDYEDRYHNQPTECVHEYSTDVTERLTSFLRGADEGKDSERTLPYMGFELEVHVRDAPDISVCQKIYDSVENIAILKEDASVADHPNSGFEIVSIPATLAWHQSGVWDDLFDIAPSLLKGWHATGCGIHVHINRRAFATNLHIAKFVAFINLSNNEDFIVDLAGRNSTQYARIMEKKVSEAWSEEAFGTDENGNDNNARYCAVNLTNSNTLEVRIFRSNVAKAGFFKCLEFTHAVWAYTKQCSVKTTGSNSLSHHAFLLWINQPRIRKDYPNLIEWLCRQKYIDKRVVPLEHKNQQHKIEERKELCA